MKSLINLQVLIIKISNHELNILYIINLLSADSGLRILGLVTLVIKPVLPSHCMDGFDLKTGVPAPHALKILNEWREVSIVGEYAIGDRPMRAVNS